MLEQAMTVKRELAALEETLSSLRSTHGIDVLEEEIKQKKSFLSFILEKAVSEGILVEDNFQIIDEGRTMKTIIPMKLRELDSDIFNTYLSLPKTKVEEALVSKYMDTLGMTKKDAKAKVFDIMSSICSIERKPKYNIIDILDGD